MKFKIGNVEISNQVCLAPMAGITNSVFRKIVKEFGCSLVFGEMISDKAIIYNNKKTKEMLYLTNEERPIAQQIFGNDKETLREAAKIIYKEMKPDIIDINMGCPVLKVAVKAQAGAALLKNIDKIYKIVKEVVEAVPCPVTVKIRSGWDKDNINAVEVAKLCEKAGASAITVHSRTRSQGYSGKADWNVIKEVKENVSIPVIGNGDITSPQDAKKMLDETNCDAIMVGRAVLGNPWLIKQIVVYLNENKILNGPTFNERINMCIRHFNDLLIFKSEKEALLEIRSHIIWYLKGLPNAKEIRKQLFNVKNKEELIKILIEHLQ